MHRPPGLKQQARYYKQLAERQSALLLMILEEAEGELEITPAVAGRKRKYTGVHVQETPGGGLRVVAATGKPTSAPEPA